jgi:hypothetical protein
MHMKVHELYYDVLYAICGIQGHEESYKDFVG